MFNQVNKSNRFKWQWTIDSQISSYSSSSHLFYFSFFSTFSFFLTYISVASSENSCDNTTHSFIDILLFPLLKWKSMNMRINQFIQKFFPAIYGKPFTNFHFLTHTAPYCILLASCLLLYLHVYIYAYLYINNDKNTNVTATSREIKEKQPLIQ